MGASWERFTPEAKKVLECSLREALQLGHNWIGTEHLLLSIIRNEGCAAAKVLSELGVDDLAKARSLVIQSISQANIIERQIADLRSIIQRAEVMIKRIEKGEVA